MLGYTGVLAALAAPHVVSQTIRAGEVASRDIIATRAAEIVDEAETLSLKERMAARILPVFKRNRDLDAVMLDDLKSRLAKVAEIQAAVGLPLPDRLKLTPREQVYIVECPQESWQRLKSAVTAGSASSQPPAGVLSEVERAIQLKLTPAAPGKTKSPRSGDLELLASTRSKFAALGLSGRQDVHDLLLLAASTPADKFAAVTDELVKATRRMLQIGPLFPETPRVDWELTLIEFMPDGWDEKVRMNSAHVISAVLRPNVDIDTEATRLKIDAELSRVESVKRRVAPGEAIVPRGGLITEELLKSADAVGASAATNWPMVISLALSLAAAFGLFGIFLYTYEPKHLFSPSSIGLMCTVSIVTCAIAAFAGHDYPQFVPLPAATLVTAIFFGTRTAVFTTILLLIFLSADGLVAPVQLAALGTATCAAFGVNIKQRRDLMLRGFLIGIMQAVGFLAAGIVMQSVLSGGIVWREITLHFLGGLSSCIVAIGSLPFLENLFGMVTPFRLAELTDPSQPLLRRLEENAPGTYQHSLAVANLAEAGARAIGADVNLVRAGALYHDIGKMVRPRYFIENQLGDKNPHDAIQPEESRDRVLAHVTDGLALARKYDLPRAVQDFIPQHQGTTLMAFFYHKACVRDGADKVDPQFFRYPGPRPQSRETAIVMLADVSEAVTHSMKDPTQEEIENAIAAVFKARWDDGQFEETGLTPAEMERIKKAFVRVWRTLHHERLKYPSTTTGRMPVAPDLSQGNAQGPGAAMDQVATDKS